jgi:formamidopyrimidine-DNA glycosylase
LYQACIHPEQYSNTLPKSALKILHEKIHTVTTTAAAVLGDSTKFPTDWLFTYRWGKSKTKGKEGKDMSNILPNGEKIKHITVGGRTSAVVESRQKMIKADGEEDDAEEDEARAPKRGKKVKAEEADGKAAKAKPKKENNGEEPKSKRKAKEEVKEEEKVTPKKRRVGGKDSSNGTAQATPTRKSSRSNA